MCFQASIYIENGMLCLATSSQKHEPTKSSSSLGSDPHSNDHMWSKFHTIYGITKNIESLDRYVIERCTLYVYFIVLHFH